MGAYTGMIFLLLALYFLPSIIAFFRCRAVAPIIVLNLFLGWTLLFWIWALIWSVTENSPREYAARGRR